MTLTGVTLLVTSLLVASPILFLISAAPSMPQRDGCVAHDDCMVTVPPPECQEPICKNVASSIQAKINWKVDVCKDFKSFSCSNQQSSLNIVKTPQEIADYQMLRKLNFSLFIHFLHHYIQFVYINSRLLLLPFRPLTLCPPTLCQPAMCFSQYWTRIPKSTAEAVLVSYSLHFPPCLHLLLLPTH